MLWATISIHFRFAARNKVNYIDSNLNALPESQYVGILQDGENPTISFLGDLVRRH